jgi:hypothetical protein
MKAINMNLKNTVSEACITVGNFKTDAQLKEKLQNTFKQVDQQATKSRWCI